MYKIYEDEYNANSPKTFFMKDKTLDLIAMPARKGKRHDWAFAYEADSIAQFKDSEYPDLESDAFDEAGDDFSVNTRRVRTFPGGYVLFEWQGPAEATIKFKEIKTLSTMAIDENSPDLISIGSYGREADG